MIRKIIHIDEEKCNGCGACANACHEGAIDMVNGKAKLMRENFCDGFGDCLPRKKRLLLRESRCQGLINGPFKLSCCRLRLLSMTAQSC